MQTREEYIKSKGPGYWAEINRVVADAPPLSREQLQRIATITGHIPLDPDTGECLI